MDYDFVFPLRFLIFNELCEAKGRDQEVSSLFVIVIIFSLFEAHYL